MDKNKILKMVAVLAAIIVIAGSLSKLMRGDSMSLSEYAALNASAHPSEPPYTGDTASPAPASPSPETSSPPPAMSSLTGAALNGSSQSKNRTTYTEGFYYEPVSDSLRRYMTGVSYPATQADPAPEASAQPPVSDFEELCYVHIWHYDFSGLPAEGELICNEYIAQDLVEIFYELYRNEYQLEKVLLVDEYDGDADAAREDNSSFCFCTAQTAADTQLSRHAAGLALDINPKYNPHVTYGKDGGETVMPASAAEYTDRTASFPYKIDESDLCYKLFIQHGFTWGGNRNSDKDYQHFQKSRPAP